MDDCAHLSPLISAWVDGALDPDTSHRVAAHVASCRACGEQAGQEREVRELIAARREALASECAPQALRARLAAMRTGPVSSRAARRWVRAPIAVAATLALALSGATLHLATGRSTTVLAAQLAADHAACRLTGHLEEGLDAQTARDRLARRYGLLAEVPPGSPDGRLQLVGARRCLTAAGRNAHIVYRYGDRLVSLFLIPHEGRAEETVRVLGDRAYLWSRHNGTYVLVADADLDGLTRVVRYMQQATR
jgi:anti-sigma factor (TIGR02949 family)